MKRILLICLLFLTTYAIPIGATAQDHMLEDFENRPETRWRFFTDTVMGGVSSGKLHFVRDGGESYARLTGDVSTRNNGGFIQMRLELPAPPRSDITGIQLVARGNDQRYFVHLRTGGTVLPWQYYQAGFDVTRRWTELRLPLTAFKPSGQLLRRVPKASGLTSVAVVAFGRDHAAEIDVLEIGFY